MGNFVTDHNGTASSVPHPSMYEMPDWKLTAEATCETASLSLSASTSVPSSELLCKRLNSVATPSSSVINLWTVDIGDELAGGSLAADKAGWSTGPVAVHTCGSSSSLGNLRVSRAAPRVPTSKLRSVTLLPPPSPRNLVLASLQEPFPMTNPGAGGVPLALSCNNVWWRKASCIGVSPSLSGMFGSAPWWTRSCGKVTK